MTTVNHVVLTRFNLPTPGPEAMVRAQENWLRNRIELFETFTVPSMRLQSTRAFQWLVYLDPESPSWLTSRMALLSEEGLFHAAYREVVTWRDVVSDSRELFPERGDLLLTTNLDNDDAVAVDFVERLQSLAKRRPGRALYLMNGLVLQDDSVYLRRDPSNAFCSVAESWDKPVTAWRDWHTLLHTHIPVAVEAGKPAWLQVVHGQNVSNRVQGGLVAPSEFVDLFPGPLGGLTDPMSTRLWRDRFLLRPARETREIVRRACKWILLAALGKEGLDRVKEGMRRLRAFVR